MTSHSHSLADTDGFEAIPLEAFADQELRWPGRGRHVLAHYDDASMLVYQTVTPDEAELALSQSRFGPGFRLTQVRWIDIHLPLVLPNEGWSARVDGTRVLAVAISREYFDELLEAAVPTRWDRGLYPSEAAWAEARAGSEVGVTWRAAPDPFGKPTSLQVPRFGVEREMLRRYLRVEPRALGDVSDFLTEQHERMRTGGFSQYLMPVERLYPRGIGAP